MQVNFLLQVTPAGYAKMTQMLNDISGGKILVILDGRLVANSFDKLLYFQFYFPTLLRSIG